MEKIARYVKGDRDYLFTSPKGKKLKKIPDAFVRATEDIGLSPLSAVTIDGKRHKIQRTKAEVEAYRRERVCFNTLRHTFAVWLASNGLVTLYELHEYLRNKNFEITKRYARFVTKPYDKEEVSRWAADYIMSCIDENPSIK